MKPISFICTTLLVAVAYAEAEAEPKVYTYSKEAKWYCNRGWSGDGRCDDTKDVYTFCCKQDKGGDFKYKKNPLEQGYAPDGVTTGCLNGGTIFCAK